MSGSRSAQHDIEPLFVTRWSTRAFTGEPIAQTTLDRLFEAARWAPSGGNAQPWRFIYARRDGEGWAPLLGTLNPGNQRWAANASALVLLVSSRWRESDDGRRSSRSHAFDAGAAWSNFAHQAHALGWSTRAMGGFDRDAARALLHVPDDYELQVVIALGRPGTAASLPEDLQAKNQPSDRLPVSAVSAEGRFAFP